ncbi:MAG: hypothetical protein QOI00_215, partial [Chloroflexota bacterium]|nr:hypothetical protein [Chloroflexota bacterium]
MRTAAIGDDVSVTDDERLAR